jgi:hypothetical protein
MHVSLREKKIFSIFYFCLYYMCLLGCLFVGLPLSFRAILIALFLSGTLCFTTCLPIQMAAFPIQEYSPPLQMSARLSFFLLLPYLSSFCLFAFQAVCFSSLFCVLSFHVPSAIHFVRLPFPSFCLPHLPSVKFSLRLPS